MGGKINDLRAKLMANSGIDFRTKESIKKDTSDQKELSANMMNELGQILVEFNGLLAENDVELAPKMLSIIEGFRMIKDSHARILERANNKFSRELVRELLDILDNFDKVYKNYDNDPDPEVTNLVGNFKSISNKLYKSLQGAGVSKIDTIGLKFNPSIHQAVTQIKNNDVDDQTVLEEVSVGYTLNGVVLKPAAVIISQKVDKKGRFRLWKR